MIQVLNFRYCIIFKKGFLSLNLFITRLITAFLNNTTEQCHLIWINQI